MDHLKKLPILISLIALIFLTINLEAKKFTRCELTRELLKNNIERTFLSNWVCLIETESDRDTTKIGNFKNLGAGYGLFQINNRTYCRNGRRAGGCNMKCEDFLNDDIRDDVQCAKLIWKENGFKLWEGWRKKCLRHKLPEVFNC